MRKNSRLMSPIIRRKPKKAPLEKVHSIGNLFLTGHSEEIGGRNIVRKQSSLTGLTLVELIIVVAILGIFMSSLFAVFKNSLDAWKKSEARLAVYQNARMVLDQMTRDIQPAIFDPANGIYAKGYEKGSGIKPSSAGDEFFFVSAISGAGDADVAEIGYWIDSKNVLRRHYDVADKGENPALDFNFTTPDGIEYPDDEFGLNITDLQFKFHYRTEDLGWAVTDDANWDAASDKVANYTADGAAQNPDGLPNGVEIEITVMDPTEREEQKFSTMVYIPQAK